MLRASSFATRSTRDATNSSGLRYCRRMTSSMTGPLQVHRAGGSDRRGGGDGPAILLCHGFGAPGDDLVSLAQVIDTGAGVRWFFPEAPRTVDFGHGMTGRAWWLIDMMRRQELILRGRRGEMMQ